jgi:hypothetical protein
MILTSTRSTSKKFFSLAVVVLMLQFPDAQAQDDYCKPFLDHDFYDTTLCDNTNNYQIDVFNWLTSPKLNAFVKAAESDFRLFVPVVNAEITKKTSDAEISRIQEQVRSIPEFTHPSSHYAHYIAGQAVPKIDLGQWANCVMKQAQGGLKVELDGDMFADTFNLKVECTAVNRNSFNIKNVFVSGAEYPKDALQFTEVKKGEPINIPLKRIKYAPIYVTFVTKEHFSIVHAYQIANPPLEEEKPAPKKPAGVKKPAVKKPAAGR